MPSTEQRRVSLAEAFRNATGKEPPAPLANSQRREYEAKVERAREDARKIYGDEGPSAAGAK